MIKSIGNLLDDIIEYMKEESTTPDTHHLFDITEDTTKLSHTSQGIFTILLHNYYIFQRGHVQTSI